MLTWLAIAVAGAALGQLEVEQDDVRLRVEVFASMYTYHLTNLAAEDITRVDIPYHHSYYFQVPEGWQSDAAEGLFRAWTEEPGKGIKPGQTEEFSLRVSSGGAVLGEASATIGFEAGGQVVLARVWVPSPEPRWAIVLVALAIAVLVLVHTAVLTRRDRRQGADGATDA